MDLSAFLDKRMSMRVQYTFRSGYVSIRGTIGGPQKSLEFYIVNDPTRYVLMHV